MSNTEYLEEYLKEDMRRRCSRCHKILETECECDTYHPFGLINKKTPIPQNPDDVCDFWATGKKINPLIFRYVLDDNNLDKD